MAATHTFADRIRAGMSAIGMDTPAQLARGCGVDRTTAMRWMAMEEADISAKHLLALSTLLRVRMYWCVTGQGFMHLRRLTQIEQKAIHESMAQKVFESLPPEVAEAWLEVGYNMSETLRQQSESAKKRGRNGPKRQKRA